MAQSNAVTPGSQPTTDAAAIKRTKEYYSAILEGGEVYHIAHDGGTACGIRLAEQRSRWFTRGSEQLIPPEMRRCESWDSAFHRELALSKAHMREELAGLAGVERQERGQFSKAELAELLAGIRAGLEAPPPAPEDR